MFLPISEFQLLTGNIGKSPNIDNQPRITKLVCTFHLDFWDAKWGRDKKCLGFTNTESHLMYMLPTFLSGQISITQRRMFWLGEIPRDESLYRHGCKGLYRGAQFYTWSTNHIIQITSYLVYYLLSKLTQEVK